MFNLANKELIEESFRIMEDKINELHSIEITDMQNITSNFIELKNQLESEIKRREVAEDELTNITQAKNQAMGFIEIMKEFEDVKIKITDALTSEKEPTKEEEPKELSKEDTQPQLEEDIPKEEKCVVRCLTCNVDREIINPEVVLAADGGKMIRGHCENCGRKLFKLK